MKTLAHFVANSWLLVGDFNKIANRDEKKGALIDLGRCHFFSSRINEYNLIDLGFVGSRFIWRGPLWDGRDRVFKRLDRALSNAQ